MTLNALDSRARPSGPLHGAKARRTPHSGGRAGLRHQARPRTTDRAWQHAMKLMMEAADGGDIEAVTKQLELALLIDGALWMERAQGRR
jgi:hypothetical protein